MTAEIAQLIIDCIKYGIPVKADEYVNVFIRHINAYNAIIKENEELKAKLKEKETTPEADNGQSA